MYYVLVRNETPLGNQDDVRAALMKDAPNLREILDAQRVNVSFVPSKDGSRFAAKRITPIGEFELINLRRRLNEIGYDLRGPYKTNNQALEFWQSGK